MMVYPVLCLYPIEAVYSRFTLRFISRNMNLFIYWKYNSAGLISRMQLLIENQQKLKTEEEQHQLLYLGFSIHQEVASDSFCFLINSSWLLVFILFLFLYALGLNLYCWKGIHFSQNLDLIFLYLLSGFIISFHILSGVGDGFIMSGTSEEQEDSVYSL